MPALLGTFRRASKTLAAAISWSEELLIPQERQLFARLSVFVGGFTLDAAEAVLDQPLRRTS